MTPGLARLARGARNARAGTPREGRTGRGWAPPGGALVAHGLVRTLHDGMLDRGVHELRWDTRNDDAIAVAAGVYLVPVQAGSGTATERLVVLR